METWTHMPAFLYATAPRERSPLPGRAHLGVEAILHKGKQGSGETKISPTNTRKSMRGYRNSIDKNKCETKKQISRQVWISCPSLAKLTASQYHDLVDFGVCGVAIIMAHNPTSRTRQSHFKYSCWYQVFVFLSVNALFQKPDVLYATAFQRPILAPYPFRHQSQSRVECIYCLSKT